MTAGITRKPCPLCKREGHRPADGICARCEAEIARLREYEQKHSAYEETAEDVEDVLVPAWWHGPYSDGLGDARRKQIEAALQAVVLGFPPSKRTAEGYYWENDPGERIINDHPGGQTRRRRVSAESVAGIRALHELLPVAFDEAFAAGVEHGRNALLQLASGDATVADFDASVSTEQYRGARRRR